LNHRGGVVDGYSKFSRSKLSGISSHSSVSEISSGTILGTFNGGSESSSESELVTNNDMDKQILVAKLSGGVPKSWI
jgi:hypothetical protein